MNVTSKISVDLTRPNIGARVNAVQGDGNTRLVEIILLSGGAPWTPPEGVDVAIAYYQPDGHKGLYNLLADGTAAISITGNVATVILAPKMLTASGTVQASLVFNDQQLNRLTTFPFAVSVTSNPATGAQKTEDYIRLQWLEDKLDEYLRKAADSGAFDGAPGPRGEQGIPGPQGEPGAPGKTPEYGVDYGTPEQIAGIAQSAADILQPEVNRLKDDLSDKLTKPKTVEVGKYFRVSGIDESGNPVIEAVDLPIGNSKSAGITKPNPGNGVGVNADGTLWVNCAEVANINNRNSMYRPIASPKLDYAVKAAMCDGKGPAWTAEEQAAARERMNAQESYRHIATITVDEEGIACVGTRTDENGNMFNLQEICIYAYLGKNTYSGTCAVGINTISTTVNGGNNIIKVPDSLSKSSVLEINVKKRTFWRASIISSAGINDENISVSPGNSVVSHRGASIVRANEWDRVSAISIACSYENGFGIGTKFDIWGR